MQNRMDAGARGSHRYIGGAEWENWNPINAEDDQFELDEAEVTWSSGNETVPSEANKRSISNPRHGRKPVRRSNFIDESPAAATFAGKSLPVNIPIWSKTLREEDAGEDEDDCAGMPPHEYLARMRGASFSVHEGVGRTLKGRDLRRVRNAIWKQTGFED